MPISPDARQRPFISQPTELPRADNTRVAPPVRPELALNFSHDTRPKSSPQPSAQTHMQFVDFAHPQVARLAAQMPAQEASQLHDLYVAFPQLQGELDALVLNPHLRTPDASGQTPVAHLHRLISAKSSFSAVNTRQVAQDLILRLNDRTRMFQGPQYTCGSAAMQNQLTQQHPALLTRLVTDLALTGKTKLQDGTFLKAPPGINDYLRQQSSYQFGTGGKDRDTRPAGDVLLQSAIMQDISLVGGNRAWKGSPDNLLDAGTKAISWLTDWAGYDVEGDDDGLMSRLSGNGGGDPILLQRTLTAITGQPHKLTTALEIGNWGTDTLFKREFETMAAKQQEMVALTKNPLHYILITGYDPQKQTVSYLSTGTYPKGSGRNSETETRTVSLDAFLANCGALIRPQ